MREQSIDKTTHGVDCSVFKLKRHHCVELLGYSYIDNTNVGYY